MSSEINRQFYSLRNTNGKKIQNKVTLCSLIKTCGTVKITYAVEFFPDLLQIHEFLNSYLDFLGLRKTFPYGVTMEYLESAIIDRHNANLFQLMYVFLSTVLKYHSIESVGYKYAPMGRIEKQHHFGIFTKHLMKEFYRCEVHDLRCDEFTISEVLRLYLITSSVPLADFQIYSEMYNGYNTRQKLAQEFIDNHATIIQSIHHDSIYRLSSGDIMKILLCLQHQILLFDAVRTEVETSLNTPSNYLGCDQSDRKYWRFDSMPGLYIECCDTWKCIDTIENLDLLIQAIKPNITLKKNLIKYGNKIAETILESGDGSNRNKTNNYQFKDFYSFDDWPRIWELKFSKFQYLIHELLKAKIAKIDFQSFKIYFCNWEIPKYDHLLRLYNRKDFIIERKLCQLLNLPEIKFADEHLNVIQGHALSLAYTYYSIDMKRIFKSYSNFEPLMHIESVAELFLNLYKLYEILFVNNHNFCCICHSDHLSGLVKCFSCNRVIHARCLESLPIVVKSISNNYCDVCLFRLFV